MSTSLENLEHEQQQNAVATLPEKTQIEEAVAPTSELLADSVQMTTQKPYLFRGAVSGLLGGTLLSLLFHVWLVAILAGIIIYQSSDYQPEIETQLLFEKEQPEPEQEVEVRAS